jgi:hypothetical protein
MDNKDMPAMPVSVETRQYEDSTGCTRVEAVEFYDGLTKHEHFAGLAMQAILSNSCLIDNLTPGSVDWLVKKADIVADAQLAELDKASK